MAKIRLWTMQERPAMLTLIDRGVLRGHEHRTYLGDDRHYRCFTDPYLWMMNEMKKRVPGYAGGFPVWFWPERPDLRHWIARSAADRKHPKAMVMIEALVDEELVLRSDFDAWHCVLNNWYLGFTEEECDKKHTDEETAASWQRVFDVEELAKCDYWSSCKQWVQVVAEQLTMSQVRSITEIIGKPS